MNTNTRVNFGRLSFAIALVLGLGLTSLAADAAGKPAAARATSHGRVMLLGTIHVTAADAEGAKQYPNRGRTAYLGKIEVTPADSEQAHYAAREAERTGTAYLGTVEVTANDSLDARYAARLADAPGTAYLGSIRVTPSKADKTLFASTEIGSRHLSRFAVLRIVSALAFGRAGG
jgi:hypothetical protein